MRKHYARYGRIFLKRMYCPECKKMTIIIDGIKQCCDGKEINFRAKRVVNMTNVRAIRNQPSAKRKRELLKIQNNKCFYCSLAFGDVVWHSVRKKSIILRINWEHLIPFSYGYDNSNENFVASCHICNGIKSNKMFKSIKEARDYVAQRREKKGIKTIKEV